MMRAALLALLLLTLSACGFQPLYGKVDDRDIEVGTYLASIKVDGIPGLSGQQLQMALEDRLNPNAKPSLYGKAFRLSVSLKVRRNPVIVEQDGSIPRYNLNLASSYRLIDENSQEVLDTGVARRVVSFNQADEKFAAYVAEKDALERGLSEMAEDYRMRLAAYFAQHYKLSEGQVVSQ